MEIILFVVPAVVCTTVGYPICNVFKVKL